MSVYDGIAERYDDTRGGERRGDEFATELDRRLPAGSGPVLEIGVGTGVVSLGLRRRGRVVLGLDVSGSMLARASSRLGPVVIRGDARVQPVRSRSVPHAVSVWVLQHIDPPRALFDEVARILRPGGRYLVCPVNRMTEDDLIEPIMAGMWERAQQLSPPWRPRHVAADDISAWAAESGFTGHVESFASSPWNITAEDQIRAIRDRVFPALRAIDDRVYEEVAGPAIAALEALPTGPITRRAEIDIVVLAPPA